MVSIHGVSVDVSLIISVVCFIFRFKSGVDFRLFNRRLWKDLCKNKRYNAPHLDSMRIGTQNTYSHIAIQEMSAIRLSSCIENFHIFD